MMSNITKIQKKTENQENTCSKNKGSQKFTQKISRPKG